MTRHGRFNGRRTRSPDHVALGEVLRALRAGRGLTQQQLADAVGIHRTYIGACERGEKNLAFENLLRIIRALGGSFADVAQSFEARLDSKRPPGIRGR